MLCMGVPLQSLDSRGRRVLLSEGSPPSFPPLVAARVKRALPFGGSPLLIGVLRNATR